MRSQCRLRMERRKKSDRLQCIYNVQKGSKYNLSKVTSTMHHQGHSIDSAARRLALPPSVRPARLHALAPPLTTPLSPGATVQHGVVYSVDRSYTRSIEEEEVTLCLLRMEDENGISLLKCRLEVNGDGGRRCESERSAPMEHTTKKDKRKGDSVCNRWSW